MRELGKLVMALPLVAFAVAEMPESAFAGVVSPVAAAPISSGVKADAPVDKAAYRFCRYTYWGKRCGPWHYGYYHHYYHPYYHHYYHPYYHRHYYWHRRLIRYCRYTYYGKVCGRWH